MAVKPWLSRETFSGETPEGETDRLSGAIHADMLGVVCSGEAGLIPSWIPRLASRVRSGSSSGELTVPSWPYLYAGGRSAGHR